MERCCSALGQCLRRTGDLKSQRLPYESHPKGWHLPEHLWVGSAQGPQTGLAGMALCPSCSETAAIPGEDLVRAANKGCAHKPSMVLLLHVEFCLGFTLTELFCFQIYQLNLAVLSNFILELF